MGKNFITNVKEPLPSNKNYAENIMLKKLCKIFYRV